MLFNISLLIIFLINCTLSLLHAVFTSVPFFNCSFAIFRVLSISSDVGGCVWLGLFFVKIFYYTK